MKRFAGLQKVHTGLDNRHEIVEENMSNRNFKPALILVLAVMTLILVSESLASWHIVLWENFNRDPQRNVWPWRTPGDPYYDQDWATWGHNPRNWPTAVIQNANCSWGLQNEIFNVEVTPNADIQSAIWCAYATERGPGAPQWPDTNRYWDNMNAWAWWGPFNLRDAESAYLSFWHIIYVEEITNDSLSVVIVNDPGNLTSNGLAFRRNCGFGLSFIAPIDDWQMNKVYMESLRVNGQETSFLGEEECYIAFVWQSDGRHHLGTGAFIDDVIVAWDDGLFDLRPTEMDYGYLVEEDSVRWDYSSPNLYDEVCFKLGYKVEGRNEYAPSFTIECYIDDDLFYSEEVHRRLGDPDTTYYSITDDFWVADSGQYLIRWEVDAPADTGGVIPESNENNNVYYDHIEVEWNPPPQFEILTPSEPFPVNLDEAYPIHWTVTDSNPSDIYFDVFLYVSSDSSGWCEDYGVIYAEPWRRITIETAIGPGEHISYYTPCELVDTVGHELYIAGVATDGNINNNTFAIASGFISVVVNWVDDMESAKIVDYSLEAIYPNPFNRSVSLAYTLPVAGHVRLAAYDLGGRQAAVLIDGDVSAGRHLYSWQPGGLSGGVYLLRLEAGGRSFMQKAVYMP